MTENVAAATSARVAPVAIRHLDRRRLGFVAATALGVTAAGIVVVGLRRPLSVDEAALVAAVHGSFRDTVGAALETDPAQTVARAVLHPVVIHGAPDWVLRLPSLSAVLAAALLVAHVGKVLAGRLAGIAAGALLGLAGVAGGIAFDLRPYALGLLAVALSTTLFVAAMTRRSGAAWALWACVAALLPLVHPACAAAVIAQGLAVTVSARRVPRLALVATAFAATVGGLLLAAAALERREAVSAGDESTGAFAVAFARTVGWSPVALVLGCWGLATLARRRAYWEATLLGGLAVGPMAAVALAAVAFPIFPSSGAVLAAVGIALAAGVGVARLADTRQAAWLVAAAAAASLAAGVVVVLQPLPADWREAAHWIEGRRGGNETVVVLPDRARAAYVRYAPGARLWATGRGDGVWVVLRTPWVDATTIARSVVSTPRYALLDERSFGDDLLVQHWVRP